MLRSLYGCWEIDILNDTVTHHLNLQLLRFAGSISTDELKLIHEAIEQSCEQIDVDEW